MLLVDTGHADSFSMGVAAVRNQVITTVSLAWLFVSAPVLAQVAFDESPDALHERAVSLARDEKYSEATAILDSILARDTKNYPVQRDYVIILTWMGRCDRALERYEKIKKHPDQEIYLITPVAQCLADAGKTEAALDLLTNANRRNGDQESQDALRNIKHQFALDRRPVVDAAAETTKSDGGTRDWLFSARVKNKINDRAAWYARFLYAYANDPNFDTGELHRLGAGVIFGVNRQLTLIEDLAVELKDGSSFGSTTTVVFTPSISLQGQLEYATFAEDIPLRARASGVDAQRFSASVNYHTLDYRWDASGGAAFYDFSDGNQRRALNASLGYAFELAPRREQRIIGGMYHTGNTLSSGQATYYNPERDLSATLTYKLDLVYESKFLRHVDHIYAHLGSYAQAGESPFPIYGLRYEQDYEFSEATSLTWGAALRRSVYDGNGEYEANFNVSVSRKL
jgi:tetratricopeptide (TPR) repeat protein